MTEGAAQNTDIEIWRERPGDYYADCVFVTQGGGLGINVGGNVVVMPIKAWHRLGADQVEARHAASISDCDQREALARQAEQVAEAFERNIGDHRQARTVPEPQLSKLKAQHWRIMAGWIRRSGGDVESTPSAKEN